MKRPILWLQIFRKTHDGMAKRLDLRLQFLVEAGWRDLEKGPTNTDKVIRPGVHFIFLNEPLILYRADESLLVRLIHREEPNKLPKERMGYFHSLASYSCDA